RHGRDHRERCQDRRHLSNGICTRTVKLRPPKHTFLHTKRAESFAVLLTKAYTIGSTFRATDFNISPFPDRVEPNFEFVSCRSRALATAHNNRCGVAHSLFCPF